MKGRCCCGFFVVVVATAIVVVIFGGHVLSVDGWNLFGWKEGVEFYGVVECGIRQNKKNRNKRPTASSNCTRKGWDRVYVC